MPQPGWLVASFVCALLAVSCVEPRCPRNWTQRGSKCFRPDAGTETDDDGGDTRAGEDEPGEASDAGTSKRVDSSPDEADMGDLDGSAAEGENAGSVVDAASSSATEKPDAADLDAGAPNADAEASTADAGPAKLVCPSGYVCNAQGYTFGLPFGMCVEGDSGSLWPPSCSPAGAACRLGTTTGNCQQVEIIGPSCLVPCDF